MVRITGPTAFALDLYLEHTQRVRASFGSITFRHTAASFSRLYAGAHGGYVVPVPADSSSEHLLGAFDQPPSIVHEFGQIDLFIDFWLTTSSLCQFHFPTILPCPAHGVTGCSELVAGP